MLIFFQLSGYLLSEDCSGVWDIILSIFVIVPFICSDGSFSLCYCAGFMLALGFYFFDFLI
jgi:hypothetical protein